MIAPLPPEIEGSVHKQCAPFFLNVLLMNKDEVVSRQVQEKAGSGLFGRAAAFAANKVITDEKIVTNLANTLMETIQHSIEDMGIHIDVQKRFQQGPLVVIQFQVLDIQLMKVIRSAKGGDFADHFQALLDASQHLGLGETIMSKIYEKVYDSLNDGMISKFAQMLPDKMKEKGVLVEVHACTAADQGAIFFDLVGRLSA